MAGAPLYIVHLSTTGALEAVAEARDQGQNAFAETCPQYLFLSADDLAREGFEGAKYVCSPPLRAREHQANLWRGLRTDDLSVVSTDHCPFCFKEQKELGTGDFSKIPNGIPGVEHRIDLTYQGVLAGEITLARWVEVNATTPARMFGLYPQQGRAGAGVGRRHRPLRPGGEANDLGGDAPHERRLLGLRGQRSHRPGRHRALPRPVRDRRRPVRGRQGHGKFLSEGPTSTWSDAQSYREATGMAGREARPTRRASD